MKSPIANDCLKVKIDGYTETQIFPKLLLQVSVIELHDNLFRYTKYGGLKEARDEYDNIIISESKLCSLLPPQFFFNRQDARSCVVVNVAYLTKVCIRHYYHGVIVI